jgi:hypothetical protein
MGSGSATFIGLFFFASALVVPVILQIRDPLVTAGLRVVFALFSVLSFVHAHQVKKATAKREEEDEFRRRAAIMAEENEKARRSSAREEGERVVERRERIVERQILVTHCKFCKELTPVDLSECKSCGARLK